MASNIDTRVIPIMGEDEPCSICLSAPMQTPIVLQCRHMFCDGCVWMVWRRRNGQPARCPFCRDEILFYTFHFISDRPLRYVRRGWRAMLLSPIQQREIPEVIELPDSPEEIPDPPQESPELLRENPEHTIVQVVGVRSSGRHTTYAVLWSDGYGTFEQTAFLRQHCPRLLRRFRTNMNAQRVARHRCRTFNQ